MKLKELEKRIPSNYYGNLSKNNKIKQLRTTKLRKAYKSNKYYDRKKMPSFKSKK